MKKLTDKELDFVRDHVREENLSNEQITLIANYLNEVKEARSLEFTKSADFKKLVALIAELSEEKEIVAKIEIDFRFEGIYLGTLPFRNESDVNIKNAKDYIINNLIDADHSYELHSNKTLKSEIDSRAKKIVQMHKLAYNLSESSSLKPYEVYRKAAEVYEESVNE